MRHDVDPGNKRLSARPNAGLLRFAVLVPHRDSRRLLEARRSSLFAAGLPGAWSFPAVAPLARLFRPLTGPELKALAAFLGEAARAGGRDGRITAGEPAEVPADIPYPEADGNPEGALRFWGPVLDLPSLTGAARPPAGTAYRPFPRVVLCAALTPGGVPPALPLPALPLFSFRAAAAANLMLSPLVAGAAGYSFRWKTGPLFWLPKNRGNEPVNRTW